MGRFSEGLSLVKKKVDTPKILNEDPIEMQDDIPHERDIPSGVSVPVPSSPETQITQLPQVPRPTYMGGDEGNRMEEAFAKTVDAMTSPDIDMVKQTTDLESGEILPLAILSSLADACKTLGATEDDEDDTYYKMQQQHQNPNNVIAQTIYSLVYNFAVMRKSKKRLSRQEYKEIASNIVAGEAQERTSVPRKVLQAISGGHLGK